MFSQRNQEEDVYDYDFQSAGNFKSKNYKGGNHTDSIPPFSPIPKATKSSVSFSDQRSKPSSDAAPMSAMDRAKSIMDKYSGKGSKPAAAFKTRNSSFNEDDISVSMDDEMEENSDMNASESYNMSDSDNQVRTKEYILAPHTNTNTNHYIETDPADSHIQ